MARFVTILFLAAMVCAAYAFEDGNSTGCGPNEVFTGCGTACESTCAEPEPRPCVRVCIIGCQCKQGYVRTHPGGPCLLLRNCYHQGINTLGEN